MDRFDGECYSSRDSELFLILTGYTGCILFKHYVHIEASGSCCNPPHLKNCHFDFNYLSAASRFNPYYSCVPLIDAQQFLRAQAMQQNMYPHPLERLQQITTSHHRRFLLAEPRTSSANQVGGHLVNSPRHLYF